MAGQAEKRAKQMIKALLPFGNPDEEYVWVRLGDVAEYEKFDTPFEAGQQVGVRLGIPPSELIEYRYIGAGVMIPPHFVGYNYISLYLGDPDAQWIGDLSDAEKREFERGVQEGLKLGV